MVQLTLYRYHTVAPSAGLVPTADATLINGYGRYTDGPASSLLVVQVEQGVKYRFRLVSISCDPNYTFSIDNHTMVGLPIKVISKIFYHFCPDHNRSRWGQRRTCCR